MGPAKATLIGYLPTIIILYLLVSNLIGQFVTTTVQENWFEAADHNPCLLQYACINAWIHACNHCNTTLWNMLHYYTTLWNMLHYYTTLRNMLHYYTTLRNMTVSYYTGRYMYQHLRRPAQSLMLLLHEVYISRGSKYLVPRLP